MIEKKKIKIGFKKEYSNIIKFKILSWTNKLISSLNMINDEITQNIWNNSLNLELIFFKSSRNEIAVSINVNPKIRNQVLLAVFSKKNTNKVANMTSGININPAPFGLGFLWLLLSDGISSNLEFLNKSTELFNIKEVAK